jgi:hypothetical protein
MAWPGSLSASVAATATDGRPAALTVMVAVPLVVSASSAADTVTFCGVAKLDGVKVSVPPAETLTSVSPAERADVTVTLPVGAEDRRTATVTMPPSGTLTLAGETIKVGEAPPHTFPFSVKLVGFALAPL